MNRKHLLTSALIAAVPLAVTYPASASSRPAIIAPTAQYLGTMTMPLGTSMVTGNVAMITTGNATTVALNVEGLQPFSSNVVRLNRGSCARYSYGPILALLTADRMGEARAVLATAGTMIPRGPLAVTIGGSNGAMVMRATMSCGNVMTPRVAAAVQPVNSSSSAVAMIFEPAPVPGVITRTGTQVLVYATGLQPSAAQPLHIHAGPCSVPNAPIRYPLTDLVSDARGRALSGTALTDFVPTARFSIHIHNTNWAMTACGNLNGL